MNYRKPFILLLLLPILLFSITGCVFLQEQERPTTPQRQGEAPSQQQEQPVEAAQPAGAPRPPVEAKLELSHAPKVGETAEATLTIYVYTLPDSKLGNIRAWLEFQWAEALNREQIEISPEEVLASGNLNWEGALTADSPLEFHTTIRFPKEGIWEITGYIEGNVGHIRSNHIELAVEHDRAGIFSGSASTPEWMKDYSPPMEFIPNAPLTATLDLSEPPKLGEHVELTWTVLSDRNFENVIVWMEFKLLEQEDLSVIEMPSESIVFNGVLPWEGSLEKDVPVSYTETVAFPEEGDWQVLLFSKAPTPLTGYYSSDDIFLNVTKESGRWGWSVSPDDVYRANMPPQSEIPRVVEPPRTDDK